MAIRVAILTISEPSSTGTTYSQAYPYIRSTLRSIPGFDTRQHFVVPDDRSRIQDMVLKICSQKVVDLLLTTGGIGLGPRDVTPEALLPLLERPVPGITHIILSVCARDMPLMALSRPVAGTIDGTFVIALPGNLELVKESLDVLLRNALIQTAIEMIKGGSGVAYAISSPTIESGGENLKSPETQQTSQLAPTPRATVASHEAQVLPDASGNGEPLVQRPSSRQRTRSTPKSRVTTLPQDRSPHLSGRRRASPSVYPMISLNEAMELILELVFPLSVETRLTSHMLIGHVLAEDVQAPHNIPYNYKSNIDGYALRSTDLPGTYPVLNTANHSPALPLPVATLYRVNAGQNLPPEADAVVGFDNTRIISVSPTSTQEETEVVTLAPVSKGENVKGPGSDVRKGDVVARRGDVMRAGEIGSLVFVGRKDVRVYKKPVVAVLSTGDNIYDIATTTPPEGGAWDTNRPSLIATLKSMFYEVIDLGIVSDDVQSHVTAMSIALEQADVIIVTGSTSLKPVIERQFHGTVHFGRVNVRPGKLTTFATIPAPMQGKGKQREGEGEREVPLFSLSENPVNAQVTFYVYVLPALRRLGGWQIEACQLPRVKVELHHIMQLDTRPEFHRVRVIAGPHGLVAHSTNARRSGRIAGLSGANGLVIVPPKSENGKSVIGKGEWAEAILIGEIQA